MRVVLCTTPRTGGTWLARTLGFGLPCELLRIGVRRELPHLGYPFGRPDRIREWATLHGIKVHWDHVGRFRGIDRLEDALPEDPEYVFLTRDDREAQARSMLTAEQTGDWFTPHQPHAVLDDRDVEARVRLIERHEQGWRGWFRDRGIQPTHVTYEQLTR